ncbi:hypothetical protein [Candidatus Poriferisodalis sp.]
MGFEGKHRRFADGFVQRSLGIVVMPAFTDAQIGKNAAIRRR